jgi:hypothetical protein
MIGTSQDGVQTAVIAMKSPIATITQPAMTVNTGVASHDEIDVAVAPRPTNTKVNPRTNRPVIPTTRRIDTLPSERSCIEYPDISEM